jgi:ABC-2 type transport system permease protein
VRAANILYLGIKELRSLYRDSMMMALTVFAFTGAIYVAATAVPETLHKAPIAIVDEDQSPLSLRIANAFYPPLFTLPEMVTWAEMDTQMDAGDITFALDIPPNFQRDMLDGRKPAIQLNVDATRVSQALTGSEYVRTVVTTEVAAFAARYRPIEWFPPETSRQSFRWPVAGLDPRVRFNENLVRPWFSGVVEIVNQITLLSIVLTGAALIREREHGTIEHLLVMPVTPFEIMTSKIWAMMLVVLAATALSLVFVIQGVIGMPIEGSRALFLAGTAMHLFATTSLGIFLATVARSMPQFGLLVILVIMPLQLLSGGFTPRESMPQAVQDMMLAAPTTHFVMLAQAILYRGAGFDLVWPEFVAIWVIGTILFFAALFRFRKSIAEMG